MVLLSGAHFAPSRFLLHRRSSAGTRPRRLRRYENQALEPTPAMTCRRVVILMSLLSIFALQKMLKIFRNALRFSQWGGSSPPNAPDAVGSGLLPYFITVYFRKTNLWHMIVDRAQLAVFVDQSAVALICIFGGKVRKIINRNVDA